MEENAEAATNLKLLLPFIDIVPFQQDKKHLIELREYLRDVGLGLNITIRNDMGSFMGKVTSLVEKNEVQLQIE
ncbi:hypothetical protein [Alkalihalobacillus deserti]|uniref:hypothetical protein n=1 Tax=Alkalihalobacillus deserti TaxID=2879466 RepID=UPI001D1481BB|nr:hypothetical protein [Alkalihalobacillus deserti]